MIDLNNEIISLNQKLAQEIPTDFFIAFQKSIDDFQTTLKKNFPKEGEILPSFSLLNTENELTGSSQILKNNKSLVIAFFRGSWCPYCNLELKALQGIYNSIRNNNSELVAISPQNSVFNTELKKIHNIDFPLLMDDNNEYAGKLNITVKVQDFVIPFYEKLGINLSDYNGNVENIIPVPAVFIIKPSHSISYSFFDVNYMNRISMNDILLHI